MDEPYEDDESEENVESTGDRKVGKADIGGEQAPHAVWLRSLINEPDSRRCISDMVSRDRLAESSGARTKGSEEHQGRESDNWEAHGVDDIATIDLEEWPMLDTRVCDWVLARNLPKRHQLTSCSG